MRHVTIHGHKRAFLDVGTGPVLLLLHGIGDDSRTWEHVVEPLARTHRVIAPDFLGHGQSDKPRADYTIGGFANGMRDLLTHLGVDTVTVVGHSLGGGVAMQFAYQYPERVDRVVLMCSGGLGPDLSPILRALSLPGAGFMLRATSLPPIPQVVQTIGALLPRVPGHALNDVEVYFQVYEHLRRTDARKAFLHVLRNAVDINGQIITMVDRLYLVDDLPILVLWGEKDNVIPSRHCRRIAELNPKVTLKTLPKSGHFPHRDNPLWFVDQVQDFMTSTEPATYERTRWRRMLRTGAQPV
jgi:pimeloyl-ACP methyl ester carboxylesterase